MAQFNCIILQYHRGTCSQFLKKCHLRTHTHTRTHSQFEFITQIYTRPNRIFVPSVDVISIIIDMIVRFLFLSLSFFHFIEFNNKKENKRINNQFKSRQIKNDVLSSSYCYSFIRCFYSHSLILVQYLAKSNKINGPKMVYPHTCWIYPSERRRRNECELSVRTHSKTGEIILDTKCKLIKRQ